MVTPPDRATQCPYLVRKTCTSTLSSVSRLLDLEDPACSDLCQPDLQVSEILLLLVTLYYLPFLPFFNSSLLSATIHSFHLYICYSSRYSALKLPEKLFFLLSCYYPFSFFYLPQIYPLTHHSLDYFPSPFIIAFFWLLGWGEFNNNNLRQKKKNRLHNAVYKITKRCLPQPVTCTNCLNTLRKRTGWLTNAESRHRNANWPSSPGQRHETPRYSLPRTSWCFED